MDGGNCFCNILWFLFAGLYLGLSFIFLGCFWCITIVGIPFGLQAFKIGCFVFWPFGKEIIEKEGGADGCDCFLNFLWIILGGLFISIGSLLDGVILCITIIGIPCGMQCFKIAKIALTPFGRRIVETAGLTITNNITIVSPTVINVNVTTAPLLPQQQSQYPQYVTPATPGPILA